LLVINQALISDCFVFKLNQRKLLAFSVIFDSFIAVNESMNEKREFKLMKESW